MAQFLLLCLLLAPAGGGADSAHRAYEALRAKDYAQAIAGFRDALAADPAQTAWRKDLAYTLLRAGEREQARDEFEIVLKSAPGDHQTALEYAFLCFETKRETAARRTFLRLSTEGATPEIRQTASQAFKNIDRPLQEGIRRWQANLAADPHQWSSHEELAGLAEKRDELALAAKHYREAWRLRRENRKLMIDLARVLQQQDQRREATALLLAASRSAETRVSETARELLPERYPYAYEFEEALEIDPSNALLRREYAYFLLALGRPEDAIAQLRRLLIATPGDESARRQLELLTGEVPARTMGLRSLEKSYLPDAIRYFRVAHEEDPADAEVMLGLARAFNQAGDDQEALVWFDRARRSGQSFAAREAARDYRRLRSSSGGFQVTTWTLPFYSSRWSSGLFYAQTKGEWKLRGTRLRPYLSARLIADTQGEGGRTGQNPLYPAYLSETAIILGVGLRAPLGGGFTAWGEAGQAISYLGRRLDGGAAIPDYRGGVAFLRGWGPGVAMNRGGRLLETGFDTVWLSRFRSNLLTYAQTRAGHSLAGENWQVQLLWNLNITADTRREYWANFVETGPGVRLRFPGLPPGLMLRGDVLRGVMLRNRFNPLGPNFWDVRAGVWYAFSR
jgi:Tfp pilus assembly protein PilF